MKLLTRAALLGGIAIAALSAGHADAAAIVDVSAYWSVGYNGYFDDNLNLISASLPTGVTISCSYNGGPFVISPTGCTDTQTLNVSNSTTPAQTYNLATSAVMRVTNSTGADLPGILHFVTDFSAFLPGSLGAQVDDPALEDASYFSSVFGYMISDANGCDTAVAGPLTKSPFLCGVSLPDTSGSFFDLPITAGDDDKFTAGIDMTASVLGVPEPITLSTFGIGLAGLAIARRKKRTT